MDLFYTLINLLYKVYASIAFYLQGTYTGRILAACWEIFTNLWIFLIAGAFVSAAFARFLPKRRTAEFLRKQKKLSILLCTTIGVASPMCTFAAIPLVGSFLSMGMPAPPLMAFLVASPLMNPSLFIYTAGALGMEMAIARTVSAFLLGLTAGWAAHLVIRQGWGDFGQILYEQHRDAPYPVVAGGAPETIREAISGFIGEFFDTMLFIGKYFLLGIFIAALVQVFLSPAWITSLIGREQSWSILIAVALGIPLYACGGGSIPVIEVLTRFGMNPGAALAFFISGPATKVQTIVTIDAVMKRRVLLFYLIIMLGGATIFGYLYNFIVSLNL